MRASRGKSRDPARSQGHGKPEKLSDLVAMVTGVLNRGVKSWWGEGIGSEALRGIRPF